MNLLGLVGPATAGIGLILCNGVPSPGASPRAGHTNAPVPVLAPVSTNLTRILAAKTNAPSVLPKPGIYRSAPYTSIVIVPDGQLDERFVIGGGVGAAPEMPTIVPHLELRPWKPAKP